MPGPELTAELRPPWPYRLPGRGRDGAMQRCERGVLRRLIHVESEPVVVSAWQPAPDRVVLRAAGRAGLEAAIERMRFALALDDDLSELYAEFRSDPLLGPAIRARPWHRPRRRPWPWEALAWAVTEQLIEASRAAAIQRRIVARWGERTSRAGGELRDIPSPESISGRAPAELAALDLAPSRALTLIRCAREVAGGRVDPGRARDDARLLRISGVGAWTIRCLSLYGRGEPDSLPAGDLAYVKLVGRLAGLGRRATIPEIEEFFAPYAPFRGLAASFILAHAHKRIAQGPPLRAAA